MSKIVAGTAFVLLGGATVTGGVLLHKAKDKQTTEDTEPKTQEDITLAKDLNTFKSGVSNQPCLKTLFSGLTISGDSGTSDSPAASNFFDTSKKTEGCLIVNWDKKNKTVSSETKWHGSLRLLWVVKGEENGGSKRGLVLFLAGKTPTSGSENAIQWEGAIYTLAGTGTDAVTWTAKQRSTIGSGKKFSKTGGSLQSNQFPQAGTALKDSQEAAIGDFWGWFAANNGLDNMYIGTEEVQSPGASLKAHWSWKGPGGTTDTGAAKLLDWTKNIDTWWGAIFETNAFSAKTATDNISGTWTREQHNPVPPTAPNS